MSSADARSRLVPEDSVRSHTHVPGASGAGKVFWQATQRCLGVAAAISLVLLTAACALSIYVFVPLLVLLAAITALLYPIYQDFNRMYTLPVERATHDEKIRAITDHVKQFGVGNRMAKATNSNRFEYGNLLLQWSNWMMRKNKPLPMGALTEVLEVDEKGMTVTVEGACTMKTLADVLLPMGYMLPIHPEMHEITCGGAIVGIGIESAGHKYGFFHDQLCEADVLCADGKIQTVSPDKDSDLFWALANSYGTLGYIVKATLRVVKVKPFVHLSNTAFASFAEMLPAMSTESERANPCDLLEALAFSKTSMHMTVGRFVDSVPSDGVLGDIYAGQYHLLVQAHKDFYLPLQDWVFRFEPDLFCNWHDVWLHRLLRRKLPPSWRNSRHYRPFFRIESKVDMIKDAFVGKAEPLIQDWEVPFKKEGVAFMEEVLSRVQLPHGKPWLIIPIMPKSDAPLYPGAKKGELLLNLGVYLKDVGTDTGSSGGYARTKVIDALAYNCGGTKMLYSTSFATEEEYSQRYNGPEYAQLKAKWDPNRVFRTVYQKCFNNAY